MRITQEMLIKIAKDHVAKRIRKEKDLVAVYLTGSVSGGEPLLGGSTDIDMIFVHKEEPPLKREVLRVTYEISLDIEHHHQSLSACDISAALPPEAVVLTEIVFSCTKRSR